MIVGVRAVRVSIPFRRPFATAAGTWHHREAWIVRLYAADGRVGSGEACLDPGASPSALEALAAAVRAHVVDGDEPVDLALVGAIEAARLDLGLATLGGPEAAAGSVAVNATIATEDPAESLAAALLAAEDGYATIKLKGGRERSTTEVVARLTAIRDAVGPDVAIRLDVNGAWDLATARARLAGLVGLGLEYVEQPIPAGDIAALSSLGADSGVPIAADESVVSATAARELVEAGAVAVLVVKPDRVGGPLAALSIAREAAAAGVGVTISTLLDTGVGLAAAQRVAARLPGGAHGLATGDVLTNDLLATPLTVHGGRLDVPPAGPLALDEAAVDRFAIETVARGERQGRLDRGDPTGAHR